MKLRLFLGVLVNQIAMGVNGMFVLLDGRLLLLARPRNILHMLLGRLIAWLSCLIRHGAVLPSLLYVEGHSLHADRVWGSLGESGEGHVIVEHAYVITFTKLRFITTE